MEQENLIPEFLYKIVSIEQWQESLRLNHVALTAFDENFIHLATEEQVSHVAQKFWSHADHMVLKLASKQLEGRLVYETNPGGSTKYYHLYEGKISLEAVVDVTMVYVNADREE